MFCSRQKLFPLILFCMSLVACDNYYHASDFKNLDDDFGKESADTVSVDTVRKTFEIEGSFNLASMLVPEKLEVAAVDDSLNKLTSVSAKIQRTRTNYSIWVESQKYPSNVARFKFTCVFSTSNGPADDIKMDFVSYLSVHNGEGIRLNMIDALLSSRIESLVKDDRYSFGEAENIAAREVNRLLEIENNNKYGVENYPAKKDSLEQLVYLYGRPFQKDSTFYSAFTKLRNAVGSNKRWCDIFSPVEIADSLVVYYKVDDSNYKGSTYPYLLKDPDFNTAVHQKTFRIMESVYGMPKCDSTGIVFKIPVESSKFAERKFVCERDTSEYYWKGNKVPEKDSLLAGVEADPTFDELAKYFFGDCDEAHDDETDYYDDISAYCKDGVWYPVDVEAYDEM